MHFVVSLLESGLSETLPIVRSVDGPSGLKSDVQVAALDGKVKPSALVLDEMKCDLLQGVRSIGDLEKSGTTDLWVPFLLQISDDALTQEIGGPNNVKDLLIIVSHQG